MQDGGGWGGGGAINQSSNPENVIMKVVTRVGNWEMLFVSQNYAPG